MNISYFRGLPVSVWRAALQRRQPAPAATEPAPVDVTAVFEGLARAA